MHTFEFIDVNDPQARRKVGVYLAQQTQAIRRQRNVAKRASKERLGQYRLLSSTPAQVPLGHDESSPFKVVQPGRHHEDNLHRPSSNTQALSTDVDSANGPKNTDYTLFRAFSGPVSGNPASQKTSLGPFGVLLSQLNEMYHQLLQCCKYRTAFTLCFSLHWDDLYQGFILTKDHEVFFHSPDRVWDITDASPINPCRDWYFPYVA